MPKEKSPEGIISRTELAKLAQLFEASEQALLPFSKTAKEAGEEFQVRIESLHRRVEQTLGEPIDFGCLRAQIRTACRRFLSKN